MVFIPQIGHVRSMPVRAEYNKILREAFESSLDILGDAGKVTLVHDLEAHGSYSRENDRYLSLWRIGEGLRNLFGQEVAELIMERVMIRMDKLYTLQQI
jgi:hypothetical protein